MNTINLEIKPPPLQSINCDLLNEHGISLRVLRLDLIHPEINGNKWFKLKQNLVAAKEGGFTTVLSFGGAYSNHLRALAAAGKHFGFNTVGVVRGEIVRPLNSVLAYAEDRGMELFALGRSEYRDKYNSAFLQQLRRRFDDFYLIPEGGSNELGVAGCTEIISWLDWTRHDQRHYLATACGTGATLAGLIRGVETSKQFDTRIIGVAVLKGAGFLRDTVNQWLQPDTGGLRAEWHIHTQYHGGGYARCDGKLENFLRWFSLQTLLPIEPVYTGKLFYGIFELIKAGIIPTNSEILALHTGGI